jgi:hypothetical protein
MLPDLELLQGSAGASRPLEVDGRKMPAAMLGGARIGDSW